MTAAVGVLRWISWLAKKVFRNNDGYSEQFKIGDIISREYRAERGCRNAER